MESLYKLFYIDNDKYKSEYSRRFNSQDSVHLNIKIGDNEAFFTPDIELYKIIVSIERTDKEIIKLKANLPGKALEQFASKCLIDEIVLTNNIEGVQSTRKEIKEILHELSNKDKKNRFVGLVNKYATLMNNNKIDLDNCNDVRKIYNDIFYDEIAKINAEDLPDGKIFRKDSVSVFSPTDKEIHKGVFPEDKIIECMEKSINLLNDKNIEPLFRIAVFHYLFGYIHPFYDGNGRTSRFIISYLLSNTLNNLIGYRISYTIKAHLNLYYEAFKVCNHENNKGDLTPFLYMFLDIIDESEKQLLKALSERNDAFIHYTKLITKLPFGDNPKYQDLYYILIQAALFSDSGISTNELLEVQKITFNTLIKRINSIPDRFIIKNKIKNSNCYMINLASIDKFIQSK